MNNSENGIKPNICAVFVEPNYRGLGLSRLLLDHICQDMAHRGIRTLYLLTDHDSYYEKLGWTFANGSRYRRRIGPNVRENHRNNQFPYVLLKTFLFSSKRFYYFP